MSQHAVRCRALVSVLLVALLPRLAFCFWAVPTFRLANGPHTAEFYTSTDGYVHLAQNLVNHGKFAFTPDAPPTTFRAPLFPFVLAGLHYYVRDIATCVLIVNCVFSALSCVLAVLIAQQLVPRLARVALLAAPLMPFSIWYCASSYSDTFLAFTVLLYAWLLLGALRAQSTAGGALAGVGLAVTCLTKAILLPFSFVLLGYATLRNRRLIRPVCASLLVGGGLIGLWTARNFAVSGQFVPISQGAGFNLLAGTYMIEEPTDARRSFKHGVWRTLDELTARGERSFDKTDLRPDGHFDVPLELDRRCAQIAREQFWNDPLLLGRKLFWNSIRFWYFTVSPERGSLAALHNFPLIALGLLGLLRWRRSNRCAVETLLLLGIFVVGVYSAIIVSGPRFALPLLLILAPFAGQVCSDCLAGREPSAPAGAGAPRTGGRVRRDVPEDVSVPVEPQKLGWVPLPGGQPTNPQPAPPAKPQPSAFN